MVAITTRLTAMEYLCHKRSQIHCVCRNHNHFLSSRMTHFHYIKVRRRVEIVEHELLTILEHLCSPVHQCISSPGKNK